MEEKTKQKLGELGSTLRNLKQEPREKDNVVVRSNDSSIMSVHIKTNSPRYGGEKSHLSNISKDSKEKTITPLSGSIATES